MSKTLTYPSLQRLGVIRPKGGTYQWLNTKFYIICLLKKKRKRFGSTFLTLSWLTTVQSIVAESKSWEKRRLHTKSKIFVKDLPISLTLKQTTTQLLKSLTVNADILRHMIVKSLTRKKVNYDNNVVLVGRGRLVTLSCVIPHIKWGQLRLFTLAVNRTFKSQNGERVLDFINKCYVAPTGRKSC